MAAGETNTRAAAAAFFSGAEGGVGEAVVPLPPTTSFLEESEEEEEEGPPGLGNVELPAGVFDKVRSQQDRAGQDSLQYLLFRRDQRRSRPPVRKVTAVSAGGSSLPRSARCPRLPGCLANISSPRLSSSQRRPRWR